MVGVMELHHPLRVIAPTVDADVLTVLARAEQEFTISTLERMIETRSAEGIRLALARLVEQGIARRRMIGRAHAYSLNRSHLASRAIVELASLREILIQRMREAIDGWPESPLYAALFGSAARGEMGPASDIDILLVRRGGDGTEQWHRQVDELVGNISEWTGNDARALDLAADDIRGRLTDDPVLADVVRDGIPVHGDPTALRRLVGAR